MRKKTALCLLVLVMFCILCVVVWRLLFPSYEGNAVAKISQDGETLYTISLQEVENPYELVIKGESGGENKLLVSKEGICVVYADCPDQVCVKRGMVAYSEIPIVCVPNKLYIAFEKE